MPRRGDAVAPSWPWRLAREGRKTRVGKIREDRAAIFGAWAIGAPTRDVRVVHARSRVSPPGPLATRRSILDLCARRRFPSRRVCTTRTSRRSSHDQPRCLHASPQPQTRHGGPFPPARRAGTPLASSRRTSRDTRSMPSPASSCTLEPKPGDTKAPGRVLGCGEPAASSGGKRERSLVHRMLTALVSARD